MNNTIKKYRPSNDDIRKYRIWYQEGLIPLIERKLSILKNALIKRAIYDRETDTWTNIYKEPFQGELTRIDQEIGEYKKQFIESYGEAVSVLIGI